MMVKKGLKVSRCIANSTDNGRMMSKFKYFTPLKFMNGFVFLEKKGGLMQHQRVMSEESANKNTQQFSWPIGLKIWDFLGNCT